jgi:hypothetical protein
MNHGSSITMGADGVAKVRTPLGEPLFLAPDQPRAAANMITYVGFST